MSDCIELHNIRAWGKHGCTAKERELSQPFDVNIILDIDLTASQASDKLSDTIDYALIYEQVVKIIASTSYNLLEKLAGEILSAIFVHKSIRAAQISIAKPGLLDGATAVVTLKRVNAKV